jgi:hypothetical protein
MHPYDCACEIGGARRKVDDPNIFILENREDVFGSEVIDKDELE